ncbi:MAG: alkaline phosphatase D family protein [Cytophagales bacterium]|nr:alkaline phosphatase D family protein [Cytophagales bacterium]
MKSLPIILITLLLFQCQPPTEKKHTAPANPKSFTIAFGSCNDQDLPQPMWDEIVDEQPDLWIWLGDNIYGDSEIVDTLIAKYNRQIENEGYQKLLANTPIIGTWDDHDYGKNDGGEEFLPKEESQQAMFDFLGVATDDPVRDKAGVYSAHSYTVGSAKVKVILLDSRYHRGALERIDEVYYPNETGTVLGEVQWAWLENELTNSDADIHLIGNGIQVISMEHPFEKWQNFPNERERLFELVKKTQAPGVIFLTGDRHIAEVSELDYEGVSYSLRDITSSGLTHSYEAAGAEVNKYRISPLIGMKNYGVLTFTLQESKLKVDAKIKGLNDTTFFHNPWEYPVIGN